jgi:hypothetical protein
MASSCTPTYTHTNTHAHTNTHTHTNTVSYTTLPSGAKTTQELGEASSFAQPQIHTHTPHTHTTHTHTQTQFPIQPCLRGPKRYKHGGRPLRAQRRTQPCSATTLDDRNMVESTAGKKYAQRKCRSDRQHGDGAEEVSYTEGAR